MQKTFHLRQNLALKLLDPVAAMHLYHIKPLSAFSEITQFGAMYLLPMHTIYCSAHKHTQHTITEKFPEQNDDKEN
jgi:hypothetical protein